MRDWWKYLSILLLTSVIYYSLTTPLGQGLVSVSVENLALGTNTDITAKGTNTKFTVKGEGALDQPRVWLSSDSYSICATNIRVIDDEVIQFDVDVPTNLPSKALSLHIQTTSGIISLKNAFRAQETGKEILEKQSCEVKNVKYDSEGYTFPNREILNESIRNLMFHVPMWFAMMLIMLISVIYSIAYLSGFNLKYDLVARQAVNVGLVFCILGLITGSLWARFTWGQWWVDDTKLNGAAITALIYFAYNILRGSIQEQQSQARIAAVYNIFAFVILVVMLMVLPRLTDSRHPGNGGNPAFSQYDLDNSLRAIFYPAVLGWIGISFWFLQIRIRIAKLFEKTQNS